MSINPEFNVRFTDQIVDVKFQAICEMASRGFQVDLISLEHYRFDGELRVVVSYAGCISGNIICNSQTKWFYVRYIHRDNSWRAAGSLEEAVRMLADDLLVTAKNCKLPLLQIANSQ